MVDKIYEFLYKLEKILSRIIIGITGIILLAITVIIFIQVIYRKVLQNSLAWSEELTKYLMVWMTFLATGYILGRGAHSNMDMLVTKLPKSLQLIINKISGVLLMFFSYVVLKYGYELTLLGTRQKSSALLIPMNYVYLSIPVGGAIMLFYSFLILIERREQKK